MRTAVYAGSFDPPTNGHLWMIERGLELFDRLYVAIGSNPSKSYTFTVDERLQMLEDHAALAWELRRANSSIQLSQDPRSP